MLSAEIENSFKWFLKSNSEELKNLRINEMFKIPIAFIQT